MAKEIPTKKVHLIDRLKKSVEQFQKDNQCRMAVMVAYNDEKINDDGSKGKVIEMRLLCDLPDELLPQFLTLFAGLVDARIKKPESENEKEKQDDSQN